MEPELTDAVPEAPPSRRRRVDRRRPRRPRGRRDARVRVARRPAAGRPDPRHRRRSVHRHDRGRRPGLHRSREARRPRQRLLRQPALRDADRRGHVARHPPRARRVVGRRGRAAGRSRSPCAPASSSATVRRCAATDVVHSWRRLFIPGDPSPLASLIADVEGARELLTGASSDTSTLGVRAEGDRTVVVDMERGGGDLPAIVSGAPFAIVPPSVGDGEITPIAGQPGRQRRLHAGARGPGSLRAQGQPALLGRQARDRDREHAHDARGRRARWTRSWPVTRDVVPIGYYDAGWIAYDKVLGPSLRTDPSLSVTYYGFDTRQAAVRRRAGAPGVRPGRGLAPPRGPRRARVVGAGDGHGPGRHPRHARRGTSCRRTTRPAPGRSSPRPATRTAPASARSRSSPTAAATTARSSRCSRRTSASTIDYATMEFGTYQERLATDPPQISGACPGSPTIRAPTTSWASCWARAPRRTRVAGRRGRSTTPSPRPPRQATPRPPPMPTPGRMAIVRDDVPAVPVAYGTSFSLVRDGLTGAATTGTGHPAARRPRLGGRAVSATVGLRGLPRLLVGGAAGGRPPSCPRWRRQPAPRTSPSAPRGPRSTYAEGITFTVPLTASVPLERVEIRLRYPGSLGPFIEEVPVGASSSETLDVPPGPDRRRSPRAQHDDRGHLGGLPGGRRRPGPVRRP